MFVVLAQPNLLSPRAPPARAQEAPTLGFRPSTRKQTFQFVETNLTKTKQSTT